MTGQSSNEKRAEKRVGSRLRGKWRLDRVIGSGGMATVYAATHRNKNRVAIKMLHPELALDEEVQTRFLREGYLANSVEHPGTVRVLDDDVAEDGAPFLVMELLDGETLEARWLRKGQHLPMREALAVVDQLLEILEAAHAKGIVHRDVKPENLFLTRDGSLKVLDFGIARLREVSPDGQSTTVGMVLGTPAFMAPEQARARWDEVDARTDLWAVGATLFTLISGAYVHESDTINEQLILAATTPAQSLADVAPDAPPALVAVVDRALAFDKADRFADAASMRAQVRAALGLRFEGPLSLPNPSIAPHTSADTLHAPEEVTAAITGKRTQTTGRPLAWDPEPTTAPRARRRVWLTGLAGAVALAAVLIGWPRPELPARLERGAFAAAARASLPLGDTLPAAAPATPEIGAGEPTTGDPAAEAQAEHQAASPVRQTARNSPVVSAPPKAPRTAPDPPAVESKPHPQIDPFDRRK